MNLITSKSIKIKSAIADVFSYVSNMENFPIWFPEVISIEPINSTTVDIGKVYLESIKVPFKKLSSYPIKVKEYIENSLFVTEGEVPPVAPCMTISFKKETENETLLEWKMESRSSNIFFKIFLLPKIKEIMSERADIGLQNLKEILEAV